MMAKTLRATEGELPGGAALLGVTAGGEFTGAAFCATLDAAEMVTVRPSLLKLAIAAAVEFTVMTAAPFPSLYVAEGMIRLPKVSRGEAGATSGSRLNVMRKVPGSVEIVGLTGDVKLKTRRVTT